jgi:hypothetical protein
MMIAGLLLIGAGLGFIVIAISLGIYLMMGDEG